MIANCSRQFFGLFLKILKFEQPKGDIVFVLTGPVKDTPCKYSIEIVLLKSYIYIPL